MLQPLSRLYSQRCGRQSPTGWRRGCLAAVGAGVGLLQAYVWYALVIQAQDVGEFFGYFVWSPLGLVVLGLWLYGLGITAATVRTHAASGGLQGVARPSLRPTRRQMGAVAVGVALVWAVNVLAILPSTYFQKYAYFC